MPPPHPVARPLTPADAPAYAALRRESLLDSPWAFLRSPSDDPASDPETVAARLREPENVIIGVFAEPAADGARLLAAAGILRSRLEKTRHRASISAVYVTPAARGRGCGRAVMLGCLDAARAWPGVRLISLSASERSAEAIGLYRALGFLEWGREPDATESGGRACDEVHMQLRLG